MRNLLSLLKLQLSFSSFFNYKLNENPGSFLKVLSVVVSVQFAFRNDSGSTTSHISDSDNKEAILRLKLWDSYSGVFSSNVINLGHSQESSFISGVFFTSIVFTANRLSDSVKRKTYLTTWVPKKTSLYHPRISIRIKEDKTKTKAVSEKCRYFVSFL